MIWNPALMVPSFFHDVCRDGHECESNTQLSENLGAVQRLMGSEHRHIYNKIWGLEAISFFFW